MTRKERFALFLCGASEGNNVRRSLSQEEFERHIAVEFNKLHPRKSKVITYGAYQYTVVRDEILYRLHGSSDWQLYNRVGAFRALNEPILELIKNPFEDDE